MSRPYQMARGWMEHPAFACTREPFDRRSAFTWLVERANFAPGSVTFGGITHQLKTGQLVASISYLSSAWMWEAGKVRRFLNRLTTDGLIVQEPTRQATYLTVCNYSEIHAARHTNRHTAETVADTGVSHNRQQTEESKYNNVGVLRESRGCGGTGHPLSNGRQWSPKIDDPRQTDLVDFIAETEAREAAPVNPEPELPLMLSGEGEVIPPGEPVPVPAVTVTPPATAAAPAPMSTNVVPHETMDKKRAARGGGGTRWELGRQVPPDWVAMAYADRERLNLPWANLEAAAADFADYWPHQKGAAAVKLDWQATWRRWARNQRGGNHGQRGESGTGRHGELSTERRREIRQAGITDGLLRRLESRGGVAG